MVLNLHTRLIGKTSFILRLFYHSEKALSTFRVEGFVRLTADLRSEPRRKNLNLARTGFSLACTQLRVGASLGVVLT